MLAAFTPYVKKLVGGATAGPYPWLKVAIDRGDVYIGLDGGNTIGVIITSRNNDELIIEQLAVDPKRQGIGIGEWLLKNIEQTARHEKVKVLSLQTAEMMTDLLRFYGRHGFKVVRKSLPAHGDDDHLRVHMIKRL